MVTTIISVGAILISVATFWLTKRSSDTAERRTRMPIVVIFPDTDSWAWRLENIGKGAALNLVIAQGCRDGGMPITLNDDDVGVDGRAPGEHWCNPIHLRPMSAGGVQIVPWPFEDTGVGIGFTDALGREYTVRTCTSGSSLFERRGMPAWPEKDWRGIGEVTRWAGYRPGDSSPPQIASFRQPVPWSER
jgi:hypothetical protein